MNFKKKLRLRERGRRAEAEKNAGSIAADHCQGYLLTQPDCLHLVPSRHIIISISFQHLIFFSILHMIFYQVEVTRT